MKLPQTNDERLFELKLKLKSLRAEIQGKSVSIWKLWKIKEDTILLHNKEEIIKIHEEMRTIRTTLERDEFERKVKK